MMAIMRLSLGGILKREKAHVSLKPKRASKDNFKGLVMLNDLQDILDRKICQ